MTTEAQRKEELDRPACSASYLQPLFDHMAQDHGLTLTESEMHDIMHVCEQLSKGKNPKLSRERQDQPNKT